MIYFLKILEQLDLVPLESLTSVTATTTATTTMAMTSNVIHLMEKHRLRQPIPFFYHQNGYQFYHQYSHIYRK